MRTSLSCVAAALLLCLLIGGCAQGPSPMAGEEPPAPELEGDPPAAGLPGEAIDPEFEGLNIQYDGDEDPGADFPTGQP